MEIKVIARDSATTLGPLVYNGTTQRHIYVVDIVWAQAAAAENPEALRVCRWIVGQVLVGAFVALTTRPGAERPVFITGR